MPTRRDFLRSASLATAGFLGLRTFAGSALAQETNSVGSGGGRFGPLSAATEGGLELPAGFRAVKFSEWGQEMDDGLLVPGLHDGMAAFPGPDGRVLLVRNHELQSPWIDYSPFGRDRSRLGRIDLSRLYDRGGGEWPALGGTTTLVFDPTTQRLERHFLSLAGTTRNCAGGATPWGTWVTCEETNDEPDPFAEQPHGYNFEVVPRATPGLVPPVPLKAMGRFRHEAICVEPRSGAVYQTEDISDGLLYRFLPREPGRLAAGGRLQALALREQSGADTRNHLGRTFPPGLPQPVRWIDLDDIESPRGDLRHRGHFAGAALFARGEGAVWDGDRAWFAMTNGGPAQLGQIFSYRPSPHEGTAAEEDAPGTLELFAEPNNSTVLQGADNLCVAPWGDIILAEDHKQHCRLIGVTPRGEFYVLARHPLPSREFAGVCFAPDGRILFVNVQTPGATFAITGPWPRARG